MQNAIDPAQVGGKHWMSHGRERVVLLLFASVLAAAFAIRAWGIMFGYPLPVHPDEPRLVETALGMLQSGDLNPHFFNYPTLNIYLQALLYAVIGRLARFFTGATSLADVPIITFYVWGRFLNVVLSTATIAATYAIARWLIHPIAGLAAACFAGASYLHITNSFTITVDSPVAFWSSLATLMATFIYTRGPRLRYYLFAGLFVGFAISSKYTAFVAALPLVIAHLVRARQGAGWINLKIVSGLILVPIAFFLTTPYAVLDNDAFMEAIRAEGEHYREGHPGHESPTDRSFGLYAGYLAAEGYGVLPLVLAGLGLLWLLWRDWKKALFLLSFPLLLFLFVGQYKTWFPRNIVATVPFLAIFSGTCVYAFVDLLRRAAARPSQGMQRWASTWGYVAAAALTLGSVSGQISRAYEEVRLITLPDTRWVSLQWIQENVPSGTRIGREHYTPPIEEFTDRYDVEYLGYFAVANKPREIARLDYMVVSSQDYERYVSRPDDYPRQAKAYNDFFARNELVKEFVPDQRTLGGPTIRIYKISRG